MGCISQSDRHHTRLILSQVDTDAMMEDTGLDYSAANEMLWRHCRILQVWIHFFMLYLMYLKSVRWLQV